MVVGIHAGRPPMEVALLRLHRVFYARTHAPPYQHEASPWHQKTSRQCRAQWTLLAICCVDGLCGRPVRHTVGPSTVLLRDSCYHLKKLPTPGRGTIAQQKRIKTLWTSEYTNSVPLLCSSSLGFLHLSRQWHSTTRRCANRGEELRK